MITPPRKRLILVTGSTKSGKSEWAETLAHQSAQPVIYVATAAQPQNDPEWQTRISRHQQRRPSTWSTLHVPVDLATTLLIQPTDVCVLIDSLGSWLTNVLEQEPSQWDLTCQNLLQTLEQAQCQVIVVGEETGWGVVPAYPLGRLFRDRLGTLVRQIAAIADQVYLVSAGYALNLKALGTYVPPIEPVQTPESLDSNRA
ncbi:MAG: bifunctional adenosylcobinamide kinase/adenosylcobinamide-phosphate guanylyltransferase [Acaryochloris sp. RU_4_1]|nr:bifunctional adenosylcobinamide kinase/adenosylcobinamide-phosphate guanylyltransferase [Acaryochloris sp. RU_4_1]NJR54586.1 bifunctional adenosylcobinamide kinase/adenosylcobinamide-phosphate guanylyltransferase [Acaryochloris sp. CRU_2_0]